MDFREMVCEDGKWNEAHRITGFLDFFHRRVFLEVETRRFGHWTCFRPQVKWKEEISPTQLGPLEGANLNHWTNPVRFTELFNYSRPD
jgi:hypothetical protein